MGDILKLGIAFTALAAVLFTVLDGEGNKQDCINNVNAAKKSEENGLIESEPELTVGGFADPLFYTSNFKLYLANDATRLLVSNPNTVGSDYDVKSVLSAAQELLKEIEYEGDRSDEFEKVMMNIDKAIEKEVDFGAPLLEDIHKGVDELENYFNVDRKGEL